MITKESERVAVDLSIDYTDDPDRRLVYNGVVIKEEGHKLSTLCLDLYEIDKLIAKGDFLTNDDFDTLVIAMCALVGRVERNSSAKDDTFLRFNGECNG